MITVDVRRRNTFDWDKEREYALKAIAISQRAREHGNTPFGCLLVDAQGNILLEQENVEITERDCTGHAEAALMRKASHLYSKDFLWGCTLYSSAEPCAMCAGAIYWGNVGRVVYIISEKRLRELTGNHPQNPTLDLPCREVFARGQKDIVVVGPLPELEEEAIKVHEGYWK
ncbi:nucleoside deaminase [Thermanaeromonas sp. C210]|uniref:nucleoside deaminase n=1 Tax=Thermanaeromonas sp. C210 TaxID=2731925 RepID=UPI00155BDEFB|nr:nucleoside deaminase [Thermanaeromonas sp. C210]GFN21695.1 tRNA-specific adenosine deaminase [Thermanaeromonas sp. C210]